MNKDVSDKLKLIDTQISNALDTITDLEEKLSSVRTDEEGFVLKEERETLKEKFASFNNSVQELTRLLVESGILEDEDVEK